MLAFLSTIWEWHWRSFLEQWFARDPTGVGVSRLMATFELHHTPPTLTLVHPNTSPSASEVEDSGAIAGNVQLDESLYACEGLPIVWRWRCSTQRRSGLCHCVGVWWNGTEVTVCILMLSKLCCVSGNVYRPLVGFWWSVTFIENEHPWGTGRSWFGCVLAIAAMPLQQRWLNVGGWISCSSWMSSMWFRWPLILCSFTHLVSVLP